MNEPAWITVSRAHWDEKVALHLGLGGYDLTSLRAGHGRFNAIEEAAPWSVEGKHILHLQCHFGADSLKLAQRGASVVGLKPGGSLYLAEAHPVAMVFDDAAALSDGRPGFFAPCFSSEPVVMEEAHDYIDETATVHNATTHTWVHPLGDIISAILAAGLTLDWLHEHDAATWRMFNVLVQDAEQLWRWPDKPWLPLAFSLKATCR